MKRMNLTGDKVRRVEKILLKIIHISSDNRLLDMKLQVVHDVKG